MVDSEFEDHCYVRVELVEREDSPTENRVVKEEHMQTDALIWDEHVLPVMLKALEAFGFYTEGKKLILVDEDDFTGEDDLPGSAYVASRFPFGD